MDSPISDCTDLEKGLPVSQCTRTQSEATSWESLKAATTRRLSIPLSLSSWHWSKGKKAAGVNREPIDRKCMSNNLPHKILAFLTRLFHRISVNCKERSYRSVATFLDSDENFMIYRRFGYLHARTLLRLQDKLRTLEELLDENDDDDAAGTETSKKCLMSRDYDEAECKALAERVPTALTRTQILDEIEVVLGNYGTYRGHWDKTGSGRL